MLAAVCRTILATHALSCGIPLPESDVMFAYRAAQTVPDVPGYSAAFLVREDQPEWPKALASRKQ